MLEHKFKVLKVKSLSKQFPGVKALDDVSINLEAGKVHALMGENGAGKSTLIKILAGVFPKNSGQIFFDDQEVQIDLPSDSLDLGIKVVYQEISLIPEFSVGENIFLEKFPVNKLGVIKWKKLFRDCDNLFKIVTISNKSLQFISKL